LLVGRKTFGRRIRGRSLAECELKYPNRDYEGKEQILLCMRAKGYSFPEYKVLSREEYKSSIWKEAQG